MNLYTNPLTYTDARRIVDALPRPRRQTYLDIAKNMPRLNNELLFWRLSCTYGTDISHQL